MINVLHLPRSRARVSIRYYWLYWRIRSGAQVVACLHELKFYAKKNRENKNNNLACSRWCNGEIFAPPESTKQNYTRFAINLDKMGPLKRNQNKNQFLMYSQSCLLKMYIRKKHLCRGIYAFRWGDLIAMWFNGLSIALPASQTRRLQTKKRNIDVVRGISYWQIGPLRIATNR